MNYYLFKNENKMKKTTEVFYLSLVFKSTIKAYKRGQAAYKFNSRWPWRNYMKMK